MEEVQSVFFSSSDSVVSYRTWIVVDENESYRSCAGGQRFPGRHSSKQSGVLKYVELLEYKILASKSLRWKCIVIEFIWRLSSLVEDFENHQEEKTDFRCAFYWILANAACPTLRARCVCVCMLVCVCGEGAEFKGFFTGRREATFAPPKPTHLWDGAERTVNKTLRERKNPSAMCLFTRLHTQYETTRCLTSQRIFLRARTHAQEWISLRNATCIRAWGCSIVHTKKNNLRNYGSLHTKKIFRAHKRRTLEQSEWAQNRCKLMMRKMWLNIRTHIFLATCA